MPRHRSPSFTSCTASANNMRAASRGLGAYAKRVVRRKTYGKYGAPATADVRAQVSAIRRLIPQLSLLAATSGMLVCRPCWCPLEVPLRLPPPVPLMSNSHPWDYSTTDVLVLTVGSCCGHDNRCVLQNHDHHSPEVEAAHGRLRVQDLTSYQELPRVARWDVRVQKGSRAGAAQNQLSRPSPT